MAFSRFLGGRQAATPVPAAPSSETEAVRQIVARLETLPPDRARFLAGTAYILARAANADLTISPEETAAMERELRASGLDEAQAVLVVEMAKLQEWTTGATSDYLVTREFKEISTLEERTAILRACYRVCTADESISGMEMATLDQIADELYFSREEAAVVKAEFASMISARFGFAGGKPGGAS